MDWRLGVESSKLWCGFSNTVKFSRFSLIFFSEPDGNFVCQLTLCSLVFCEGRVEPITCFKTVCMYEIINRHQTLSHSSIVRMSVT